MAPPASLLHIWSRPRLRRARRWSSGRHEHDPGFAHTGRRACVQWPRAVRSSAQRVLVVEREAAGGAARDGGDVGEEAAPLEPAEQTGSSRGARRAWYSMSLVSSRSNGGEDDAAAGDGHRGMGDREYRSACLRPGIARICTRSSLLFRGTQGYPGYPLTGYLDGRSTAHRAVEQRTAESSHAAR
jgi:hypothetical protein